MNTNTIIAVNAGSSSIKLVFFAANEHGLEHILEAQASGIGSSKTTLSIIQPECTPSTHIISANDTSHAAMQLLDAVEQAVPGITLSAIGHRIVHGGPDFSEPVIIDTDVLQKLESLVPFSPNHAPTALQIIQALQKRYPDVPQVACFDTAFFHNLPNVARHMALPRGYRDLGLRRYGFHGLSYTYLLDAFARLAGQQAAHGRIIMAHLGSGASLAAIKDGVPVDTTMGLTPASGIIMSSRSGDIDPGVAWFLHQQAGLSLEEYNRIVTFESGLLGISGISADMHTLIDNESANPHAAEAVAMFCYSIRKAIGSLAATMGGVDSLIFSGGIGEQSAILRGRICEGLDFLGIRLDPERNEQHLDLISAVGSKTGVHVLPTNEAAVIGQQTVAITSKKE